MVRSIKVDISRKMLKWARETSGFDIETIASRMGETKEDYLKWEDGNKKLTYLKLEKLANIFKRPSSIFYLEKPPEEPPLPTDMRTLPQNKGKFSPETLIFLRRVRYIQSMYKELTEEQTSNFRNHNINDLAMAAPWARGPENRRATWASGRTGTSSASRATPRQAGSSATPASGSPASAKGSAGEPWSTTGSGGLAGSPTPGP